jgi:hypothetical protein
MLVSKEYGAARAAHVSLVGVRPFCSAGPVEANESANTTNLAVADQARPAPWPARRAR